ncbi:hypothetical protein [Amycolatopsis albispora]|uniref:DUF1877 domain-containing protein n=1 Tax=Amycolatopsis albispora TaxID=1804986 RepID=A0A344L3E5_9PSEU|nr:hypothetical protein [Amycolatopsis albispora]AXB42569.1 hypothetical protein A4R43_08530 [Amycolatopsis albispora]
MGVLFDYFAAPSDEAAAATIDRDGGPGSPAPVFDTLPVKGVDPVVQLGTLEAQLTGRAYADIVADPRSGRDLASRGGGERLVLTVTDSLAAALAAAPDERLAEVAVPWSETEEFWGQGDPVALADFLRDFAALARRADQAGHRLYCWLSV